MKRLLVLGGAVVMVAGAVGLIIATSIVPAVLSVNAVLIGSFTLLSGLEN